jgi:transcriptional regulator with XRE-family HTH domain
MVDLDALAGLTRGHISAIESGHRTSIEARTAQRIADALGVSLDWLVSGRGETPTQADVKRAVTKARKSVALKPTGT